MEHGVGLRRRLCGMNSDSHLDSRPYCSPSSAFEASAEGAAARLHSVGRHQHRVRGEERGDLRLVGLELVEGGV